MDDDPKDLGIVDMLKEVNDMQNIVKEFITSVSAITAEETPFAKRLAEQENAASERLKARKEERSAKKTRSAEIIAGIKSPATPRKLDFKNLENPSNTSSSSEQEEEQNVEEDEKEQIEPLGKPPDGVDGTLNNATWEKLINTPDTAETEEIYNMLDDTLNDSDVSDESANESDDDSSDGESKQIEPLGKPAGEDSTLKDGTLEELINTPGTDNTVDRSTALKLPPLKTPRNENLDLIAEGESVTIRKKAEEQLRRSEAANQVVQNAMDEAIGTPSTDRKSPAYFIDKDEKRDDLAPRRLNFGQTTPKTTRKTQLPRARSLPSSDLSSKGNGQKRSKTFMDRVDEAGKPVVNTSGYIKLKF